MYLQDTAELITQPQKSNGWDHMYPQCCDQKDRTQWPNSVDYIVIDVIAFWITLPRKSKS
jgi:hypothetical protein